MAKVKLDGIDLEDLDASFGGFPSGEATPNKSASDKAKIEGIDFDTLDAAFGTPAAKGRADNGRIYVSPAGTSEPKTVPNADAPSPIGQGIRDFASGAWQGIKDIPTTGAQAIGYIDSKVDDLVSSSTNPTVQALFGGGNKRNEAFKERMAKEEAALPVDNSAFDWGRLGGQVLATAPLGATVPEFAAVKAVPYVGRIGASVLRGATGGAEFGAATSSANKDGLLSSVGENAAYGAIGGPIAEGALKLGKKALGKIEEKIAVNSIVKNTGIDPNAARNVLARLTEANIDPSTAIAKLRELGPGATLADLSPSLTTEASGLAAKGGEATNILKTRYGDRAADANNAAHDLMETKLGTKPDYEAEKAAAKLDRQQKTSADYTKAKASNMALDVMPVARNIAAELQNAVGAEAKELHDIGSYLFTKNGDIKTDTAPLLKVRQALDDRLSRLKSEGTSMQSSTYRSVSKIRDELDQVLKTNPDLAAADTKYAKLKKDFEGLELGREAIGPKGNLGKFKQEFDNASPEKQDFMRKGLRIQIGDLMEKASRGELSEAQRLFGKSTKNREIIKHAFGQDGEEVLNALEKEANMRAVEHAVKANSLTAERLAVQKRPEYGGPSEAGIFSDIGKGLAVDVMAGTHGAGAVGSAAMNYGKRKFADLSKKRIDATIKGTADLLSRQSSQGRGNALDVLNRIDSANKRSRFKLPVDYNGLDAIAQRGSLPVVIEGIKGARKKFLER